MMNMLTLVVVLICGFALVTSLITLGIPFWRESDGGTVLRTVKVTIYSGLWQTCTREQVESTAISCSSGGCVFLTIALVVYGTSVKSDMSFKAKDLYAGFGMTIIAAILIFIAGVMSCFVQ